MGEQKALAFKMKFYKYWLPPIYIAITIFFLSGRTRIAITHEYTSDFIIFKTMHMIEYALFFLANYRAVLNTVFPRSRKKSAILALVISISYALTDEIHQTFVPTRDGKLRDVIFDTIGASLAYIFIWRFIPQAPPKLKKLAETLQII